MLANGHEERVTFLDSAIPKLAFQVLNILKYNIADNLIFFCFKLSCFFELN